MGMTVPRIVDAAIQGACRQIGTEPAALDVGSVAAACNFSLNEQGLLAGLMAETPGMAGKSIERVDRKSVAAASNFSLNEQGLLAGLMADTPGMAGKPIES